MNQQQTNQPAELETFRPYLRFLARLQLAEHL